MSTALQLVNRVKVKLREDTGTVVTDDLSVAVLDNVNTAMHTVLEEMTWKWQERSDGILELIADDTGADAALTNDDATVTIPTWSGNADEDNGDFVLSVNFSADASYGDVTFDFDFAEATGAFLTGDLTVKFPGTTTTTGTYRTFVYQYALPTTVKKVTSVRDQEGDLDLVFEDERLTFNKIVPRPHEEVSDRPRIAMVGGTIQKTRATTSSTVTYADAIKIWPVPDSRQILNYNYVYKQAKLVAATDETVHVPNPVEDLIVDLAYAHSLVNIEDDPQRGFLLEERVMRRVREKHANAGLDPFRHRAVLSADQMGARVSSLRRTHRTVPTLTLGSES